MIVVTLFAVACGYLKWQANIVSARKAMIRHIQADDHAAVWHFGSPPLDKQLSLIRQVLGDEPIAMIALPENTPKLERNRIHELLPEAELNKILGQVFHGVQYSEIPFDD
jgi:hypothetical protein